MKKNYILLSILGLVLFLSSCLKEGMRNYSEEAIVYIASEEGVVFGKTLTGRGITSSQMQQMTPGTFWFISYSWEEENGITTIGQGMVDNVVVNGDPKEIKSTTVILRAPESDEDPNYLLDLGQPFFVNDRHMLGDNWLFRYAYEIRSGEEADLQFFIELNEDADPNDITLMVKLDITGQSESNATLKTETDVVAVNMSPLRAYFERQSKDEQDLRIKIKFDKKGSTVPVTMPQTFHLSVGGSY